MKNDTNKIVALKNLGNKLVEEDTAMALKIDHQALALSRSLGSKYYEAKVLTNIGIWYFNAGRYDTAKIFYHQALAIAQQLHHTVLTGSVYNNLGNAFLYQNQNDSASYYFLKSAKYFEQTNDTLKLGVLYGNLAALFNDMHLYSQGLLYSKKAIQYALLSNDDAGLCQNYTNAAAAIAKDSIENDTVKYYRFQALYYGKKSGIQSYIESAYHNVADFYLHIENYNAAKLYADTALAMARKLGVPYHIGTAVVLHGLINLRLKNFSAAEKDFNEGIPIAKANRYWQPLRESYLDLAEINEHNKDWQKAYTNMHEYAAYKDSAFNDDVANKLQETTAKYEAEKREQQIKNLRDEQQIQYLSLRKKTVLEYSFLGGLIATLAIISLLFINFKRQKQLAQKSEQLHTEHIKKLEQEKQLVAVNSLVKGQEEERSRMAKDLHDGLGGMLSGVKLNLNAMKGNVILPEAYAQLFSKTLLQLDNSMSEMRRVAHNMMPEALVKLGLVQAIEDYCVGINESGQLHCVFQHYGMGQRLDTTNEIIVYRILQELMNNVIRHAAATEMIVQLVRTENRLSIAVEDNGKGFDSKALGNTDSAGLSNVQSRVKYLHGTMDIQSKPGQGTSVYIDCLIDKAHE